MNYNTHARMKAEQLVVLPILVVLLSDAGYLIPATIISAVVAQSSFRPSSAFSPQLARVSARHGLNSLSPVPSLVLGWG